MKRSIKVTSVVFAFLALTWLLPPDGFVTAYASGIKTDQEQAFAAAAARANSSDTNMMQKSYTLDSSSIVGEVPSRRDKFTKVFRMQDGTFQAVSYSSAVNYKNEKGDWAEIDNTLQQVKDKAGNSAYKTKSNGYMDVSFANNSKSSNLVSISKGKYSISWGIANLNGVVTTTPKATPQATVSPTISLIPSFMPTPTASLSPTITSSIQPKQTPSAEPTATHNIEPSTTPSAEPTTTPSSEPTTKPTETPSSEPSATPSADPTATPDAMPSTTPSAVPTAKPSAKPSAKPTVAPSLQPTATLLTQEPTDNTVQSVVPAVVDEASKAKSKLSGNSLKRFDDKSVSHIKYAGVAKDVNFDYVVEAERVKEDITLGSYTPNFSVSFDISANGLTTKAIEGGITAFCDGDTEVFYLMPSIMLDNANNNSQVKTTIQAIKGGYRFTLTPDDSWLKSAKYPVVVDPDIRVNVDWTNVYDTTISTKYHNGQNNNGNNGDWYKYASLYLGNSNAFGYSDALIQYNNLPTLTSSEAVVGAYWMSECYDPGVTNAAFTMHRILKSWNSQLVTWDNFIGSDPSQAYDTNTIQDAQTIDNNHGGSGTIYTWDITNLVRGWYTGNIPNYGFLIKYSGSASTLCQLYASDAKYNNNVMAVIQFENTAGLESYWSYKSIDARRAGTAYVNLFTGNLVLTHDDIGTSGDRLPVSISHIYNAVYKDTNIGYGMGWRLNYSQTIVGEVIGSDQYYDYTDEDGTVHYFKQSGSSYLDESGENRTLEINKQITDIDNNTVTYSYTITDKNDNVLCFDGNGRLVKIKDCIGNYISISYSGSSNMITSISDGARRSYTLSYNGDLSSIAAPGNRTVTYGYDGNHRLLTVLDPDNVQTQYNSYYETSGVFNNAISQLLCSDGENIIIYYHGTSYMNPKVSRWNESFSGQAGSTYDFTYYPKETKVQDQLNNINVYQFNQYGNAVNIQDDKGRAVYCQYYDPNTNVPGTSTPYGQNRMSLSSRLQEPVMNLAKDSSFEVGSDWVSVISGGGGISRVTDQKVFGSYGLCINTTNSDSFNYCWEFLPVEKGATYTLSGWIKTSNIVSNSYGALIQACYKDGNGVECWPKITWIAGTNDWTRYEVTFTVPINSTLSDIWIFAENFLCTGTAWFDGIQLEKQPVANKYNLIQNGDMTYATGNTPDFWSRSSGCTSSDTTTTLSDNTGRGLLDNNVFQFTGDTLMDKSLSQTVMVSGNTGDSFSFGGWAKASALPMGTKYGGLPGTPYGRQFAIKADLYNGGTSAGTVTVPFNAFSSSWQYASGRVVATGSYDRVVITLLYQYECNTAQFDGVQLYKEEFGQCYDYDAKGNLITARDLSSQTNSVSYDANNNPTSLQPPDCTGNDKYTVTYLTGNQKHLVDTTNSVEGVKSKYFYDSYGNATQAETRDNLANPTSFIRTKADYTSNGNYMQRLYDAAGNYSTFDYDSNYGVNKDTTDPSGQVVNYTYDGNNSAIKMGKLTNVSATVGGTTYSNSYGYTNDLLTTITHNGFSYSLGYNAFNQMTTVGVAGQPLVTNYYRTDRSFLLDHITYGNDSSSNHQTVAYAYDDRYRVTALTYDNESTPRYKYSYAANGKLGSMTDNQNSLTTNLYYDLADRPMKTVEHYSSLTRSFQYTYDIDNCLTQFLELINSTQYKTALSYDKDNRITKINFNDQPAGSENVRYAYDALGRLNTRTLETGTNDYVLTYNYLAGGYGTGSTTGMVSSISYNGASSLSYTYDNCRRILTVGDGTNTIHYAYDGLGQLLRTDDPTDTRGGSTGSTWAFAYDAGGNITSKKLYAYAYGDNDLSDNTVIHNTPYTYDTTWKDKLASYDGNSITYDAIGNPLTYNGWNYTWEAGRQLQQMSNGSTTLQFKYNDAGLRTQKINGSTTTKYYWSGSVISHMTSGSDTLHFYYDGSGQSAMVAYNGTNYYYKHNLQGDIIGLLDMSGSQVVAYTYDSWGNQLSCTGSLASTLGAANPLRYRGYIYDSETGLYYLQSRYYNPQWGRFVSADAQVGTGSDLVGANLFTYCGNDPVNRRDPTGQFWDELLEFIQTAVTASGSAIAQLTPAFAGCGAAAIADGPLPIGDIIGGICATALFVGAIGYGICYATQAQSKPIAKAKTNEKDAIGFPPKTPTTIYRYGGTNPGNLTPKEKDKYTGVSFSTIPIPGAAETTVEAINATGIVYAVQDGPTHYSVKPVGASVSDWINAGTSSIWTMALKAVVIKWDPRRTE